VRKGEKMNRFLLFLTTISLVALSQTSFAHDHHSHMADEAEPASGDSLYHLHSVWQTQSGQKIQLKTLQGHPVVIAMAYTSCQSSCPVIVEEMKQIESHLKKKEDVRFLFASFDSKRDTPEQLKKFAEQRKLDLNHWILLHGSKNSVQELAAALGLKYKEDAQGEFDHSNMITILDSKGVIHFQQVGLNKGQDELEQKLAELVKN
jgi:protein SCO1/2